MNDNYPLGFSSVLGLNTATETLFGDCKNDSERVQKLFKHARKNLLIMFATLMLICSVVLIKYLTNGIIGMVEVVFIKLPFLHYKKAR